MVRLKLPLGYRVERDPNIENSFRFYEISNVLLKSNTYISLKSLIEDCIDYDKRVDKLKQIKLNPGFRIETSINDPISYLFYNRERIASSSIIEDLIVVAEKAETNYTLMNKLNNGEEIEI